MCETTHLRNTSRNGLVSVSLLGDYERSLINSLDAPLDAGQRIHCVIKTIRDWLRRRKHEKLAREYEPRAFANVWYFLNFGTAGPSEPFSQEWIDHHYDFRDFIRESHEANQAAIDTGLLMAHRILVSTVEGLTPNDREEVRHEVVDNVSSRSVTAVTTAIRVLVRNTHIARETKGLDATLVDIACDDVMAAVLGNLNAEDRQQRRILAPFLERALDGLDKTLPESR